MNYKCIDYHYCASLSKHFHRNDNLSSAEYDSLPFNEKRYFKAGETESLGYNSSVDSNYYNTPPSSFDFGSDSGSSSDSSGFDFGGGDFGGGGASGDF